MLQLGLNAKYRSEGSVAVTYDDHDDDADFSTYFQLRTAAF
jgi:hypothetical protein